MADDPVYGFNKADKDAIIRSIDSRSSGGGNGFPNNGLFGNGAYDGSTVFLAVATTGVPARSGTTLGKATDLAVKYLGVSSGNRVILDAGYTVTAHNLSETAVATGAYVILTRFGDVYVVTWEDC
jgi:hypothetical protein